MVFASFRGQNPDSEMKGTPGRHSIRHICSFLLLCLIFATRPVYETWNWNLVHVAMMHAGGWVQAEAPIRIHNFLNLMMFWSHLIGCFLSGQADESQSEHFSDFFFQQFSYTSFKSVSLNAKCLTTWLSLLKTELMW